MAVKLLTVHHLEFQSLKGGCIGSSESTLVKLPHCWKSHAVAQIKFATALRMISNNRAVAAYLKVVRRRKTLSAEVRREGTAREKDYSPSFKAGGGLEGLP